MAVLLGVIKWKLHPETPMFKCNELGTSAADLLAGAVFSLFPWGSWQLSVLMSQEFSIASTCMMFLIGEMISNLWNNGLSNLILMRDLAWRCGANAGLEVLQAVRYGHKWGYDGDDFWAG